MEIRSYEGDAEDLAKMMRRTWTETYLGKMWFPLWGSEFLRWQMGSDDRRLCLAAYHEGQVVGCFLSAQHSLRIESSVFPITFSSWCTVDPEFRLPRLGLELIEELRRRHEETGKAFSLGIVSGDPSSIAHRFWSQYARVSPQNFRFISRVGFWVKILDPHAMSKAGISSWERLGIKLMGPVLKRTPFGSECELRPYRASDLDTCAGLLEKANQALEWAVTWTPHDLARQLAAPGCQTLLYERNGEVCGMVNYHHLQFQGREPVRMVVIDLWVTSGLNLIATSQMLGCLCDQLRREKIQAIVSLRSAIFPTSAFVANGFLPLPSKDYLVALFMRTGVSLTLPMTWSLLFR